MGRQARVIYPLMGNQSGNILIFFGNDSSVDHNKRAGLLGDS